MEELRELFLRAKAQILSGHECDERIVDSFGWDVGRLAAGSRLFVREIDMVEAIVIDSESRPFSEAFATRRHRALVQPPATLSLRQHHTTSSHFYISPGDVILSRGLRLIHEKPRFNKNIISRSDNGAGHLLGELPFSPRYDE
uniref:Uncharacterized protein n=1 Tax=Mycena chlorophos TaxID=658473 RepID=A0ABQ0LC41_MYCCL|nr:predicted protein [Mycena chlorophos]